MRILMVVPKYPFPVVGGLERQAHELAKALAQRGHAVSVLSSRFESGQKSVELVDGILVYRAEWIEFRPARFLLSSVRLGRIFYGLKGDVDLVHVHNISWFGAFFTLFAKVMGLPVITKLPNFGAYGIHGARRRPFGVLWTTVLKRSNAIIAMTQESMAELAGICYPPERILKVTNGISLLPHQARIPSSSSAAVTAVFVGSLVPQKGLLNLLHAWAAVKTRVGRPATLQLIGDGPQADELRALVLSLGIRDSVEFCGYCNDVPTELAKADLFILPSNAEGNSNAILEAMRAGLPIIATRVGGARIQVGCEGARFLVPFGDCDALADRMLELIEGETLRRHLGAAMRARIEKVFVIEHIAEVYEQAYELILSGRAEQIGEINPGLFGLDEPGDSKCAG